MLTKSYNNINLRPKIRPMTLSKKSWDHGLKKGQNKKKIKPLIHGKRALVLEP
jgi:hypothetical protein